MARVAYFPLVAVALLLVSPAAFAQLRLDKSQRNGALDQSIHVPNRMEMHLVELSLEHSVVPLSAHQKTHLKQCAALIQSHDPEALLQDQDSALLPDPLCKKGIVSSDLQTCCAKDCGACDTHSMCEDRAKFAEATGKVAEHCCPLLVKKNFGSCEESRPPCMLSDKYREASFDPNSIKDIDRHAMTDCTEAVRAHVYQMKEAVANGQMRGDVYNWITRKFKAAITIADKVQNKAGHLVKEASSKVTKVDAQVETLTTAKLGPKAKATKQEALREQVDQAKDEKRFYKQLVDNADTVENEASSGDNDADKLSSKISHGKKPVSAYTDRVGMLTDEANKVYDDAQKLWKQYMDAAGDFDCSAPPAVSHAAETCTKGNTKHSRKCDIECKKGYDLRGNELRCSKEGKFGKELYGEWKGAASCVAKNCGVPRKVEFSRFAEQEIRFPFSSTYTCFDGFSQDGTAKGAKTFEVTCNNEGTFDFDMASHVCKPVTCGNPPALDGGKAEAGEVVFPKLARYTCDEGHSIDGTPTGITSYPVTCQSTGEFTERSPCLPVRCGRAPLRPHSSRPGKELVFDNTIAYDCKKGFSLDGTATGGKGYTLQCLATGQIGVKGQPISPRCEAVQCGEPPAVQDATVIAVPLVYSQTALVQCAEGFSTTGKAMSGMTYYLTCEANGQFSGAKKCKRVECGAPPTFLKSTVHANSPPMAVYGNELNYDCADGFSIDASAEPTSTRFSIVCEATGTFTTMAGGNGKCVDINDCVGHTCGPFGSCVDGHKDYSCECARGFELVIEEGTNEKICGNIDDCGPSQCGMGECEDLVEDYTCHCPEGYEQTTVGDEKTCTAKICGLPPTIRHGTTAPEPLATQKAAFDSAPVTFACHEGFSTDGLVTGTQSFAVTCQANKEFTAMSECKPVKCEASPTVVNGKADKEQVNFGEVIRFTCDEGHTIDGSDNGDSGFTVTCNTAGELSVASECLPVVCGVPDVVANGFRPDGALHFGQTVEYLCWEGHTLDGEAAGKTTHEVECKADGSFSPLEDCNPVKCGMPEDLLNVRYATVPDMGNVRFPETVEIQCDDGFTVDGNGRGDKSFVVRCGSNGNFGEHQKRCEPVDCGAPPTMPYSTVAEDAAKITFTKEAVYTCAKGYTIGAIFGGKASFKAQCLPSGEVSVPTDDLTCLDVDECQHHTCGPHGTCKDKVDDYDCRCEQGFEVQTIEGEKFCGNKDDCGTHGCGAGTCVDLVDDYTCSCPEGHLIERIDGEKSCVPQTCATAAPEMEHGTLENVIEGAVVFPMDLKYECAEGHSIDGTVMDSKKRFRVSCEANGRLTEMFQCQPISCGTPHVLRYVSSEWSSTKSVDFAEKVTYKCDQGYAIGGTTEGATEFTVECKADGRLSEPDVCEAIKCGEPPRIMKSRAQGGGAGVVSYPFKVDYRCDFGHTLDGTRSGSQSFRLGCEMDGAFSGRPSVGCQPVVFGPPPNLAKATLQEIGGSWAAGQDADPADWVNTYYKSANIGYQGRSNLKSQIDQAPVGVAGFCELMTDAPLFQDHCNHKLCNGGMRRQIGQHFQLRFWSGVKGAWKFRSGLDAAWWVAFLDGKRVAQGSQMWGPATMQGSGVAGDGVNLANVGIGPHQLDLYTFEDANDGCRRGWRVQRPGETDWKQATKENLNYDGVNDKCKCSGHPVKHGAEVKRAGGGSDGVFVPKFGDYCKSWGPRDEQERPDTQQSEGQPWCYVRDDCPSKKSDGWYTWDYCVPSGEGKAYTPLASMVITYPESVEYKCRMGYTVDGSSTGATKFTAVATADGSLSPPLPVNGCVEVQFSIGGVVRDARNNAAIAGITVAIEGTSISMTTGANGLFMLTGVPAGRVSVKASGADFIANSKIMQMFGNIVVGGVGDFSLSPKMRGDQWRMVLRWGPAPRDLDSHAFYGGAHVYYPHTRRAVSAAGLTSMLENDDTSGFGPETFFFEHVGNCRGGASTCDIRFLVYNYNRRPDIKTSGAQITLYHGVGVAATFTIPSEADPSVNGYWWHAFTIDGRTNSLKWGCCGWQPSSLLAHGTTKAAGYGPWPKYRKARVAPKSSLRKRAGTGHKAVAAKPVTKVATKHHF